MGTYADSLLSDGEVILVRQRQHWFRLLAAVRAAIALWIIGVVLVALLIFLKDSDVLVRNTIGAITTVAVVIGIVVFILNWWQWRTEEYLVTNRRLLKVSGILNKQSADSSLEKINDVVLFENMFGRMFDYGDLDILTAAEVAVDRYTCSTTPSPSRSTCSTRSTPSSTRVPPRCRVRLSGAEMRTGAPRPGHIRRRGAPRRRCSLRLRWRPRRSP